jgi:hypothetical protein
MVAPQGLPGAPEGGGLRALDIHLDAVHSGEAELGDDLVDGGQRTFGPSWLPGKLNTTL